MASELLVPDTCAEWPSDVMIVLASASGTVSLSLHA